MKQTSYLGQIHAATNFLVSKKKIVFGKIRGESKIKQKKQQFERKLHVLKVKI